MKLLFDQNLSPHLPRLLSSEYPESFHVREAGLARANDEEVWSYAKAKGFTIVSKDSDFHQMSFTFGAPPKVIWIRLGNCSTEDIVDTLRSHQSEVYRFGDEPESAFLELG